VAYIGSDDGSLYAVDARTGQMQWKFDTGGIVRSTPSIAEGSAFIASDDGNVYAVNIQDGTQIWKTDIGNAFPREEREVLGNSPSPTGYDYRQSSPVFANGLVYVGSYDGNVYALAANDGKVIWTFKTGEKVRATPTIVNDVVYIGSWDKKSYALEASTGKLLWETPVYGQVQTTALVVDDLVITASRKASVQALNIDTGELVWEFEYGPNNWVESSPTLAGDKIVIGSSGARRVIALDYKTGKIFWSFSSEAFNWSTPLPVGNTVYIGGAAYQNPAKGALFVLKVSDQVVHPTIDRRIFSILETLEPSGEVNGVAGSPVMVDGILYFGALDGRLYAVRD
jgi:outer membrane protein assembly factor BamB